MIYYSTGTGAYMRSVGKAVELDDATAQILIKKGFIVESKDQIQLNKQEVVEVKETVIETVEEVKPKVIKADKQKVKPKGRPKRK